MTLQEIVKGAHARITGGWSPGLSFGPEGVAFQCGACFRVHTPTRGECPPVDLEATHWTLEDALWSASGGGQRGLTGEHQRQVTEGDAWRDEREEAVLDHEFHVWSTAKDCKAALGVLEMAVSRARAIDRAG